MSYRYRKMFIDPRSEGPSGENGWSAYVLITEMGGAAAQQKEFYISGRFKTQELALETALTYGKRKVDELRKKSADVREIFEQANKLPSTARVAFGMGSRFDDVAIGSDGEATRVHGPHNPEDRFRSD